MKVTYFGTTVLLFDDGKDQILLDAHFTRPSLFQFAFGKVSSNHQTVDSILKQYPFNRLKAIFISHTHYDHCLDLSYLAESTKADVYGSPSCKNVINNDKVPFYSFDQSMNYQTGKFHIQVIPSIQSKTNWYNNDLGQIIDKPIIQPASRKEFKEGGSFDFVIKHNKKTYLIRPSCNYIEGQLDDIKADVLYLGIGAMSKRDNQFKKKFFEETIQKVQPKTVIPIHWDNFFKPLSVPSYNYPIVLENPEQAMHDLANYCSKNNIECLVQLPLTSVEF